MTYWKIETYPLLIKHKSIESYYTGTVWAIEKSTHTQGRRNPHKLSTGLQSPSTPGYYDLVKKLRHTALLIKHKSIESYYTRTVWAIEKSTHTQGRQAPHKLSTGLQSPSTPGYYDLVKIETYHPANQAQVYRALLHHDNISYWEIETNPGQIDPLLIEHKSTKL